jgi:hypothetical protein
LDKKEIILNQSKFHVTISKTVTILLHLCPEPIELAGNGTEVWQRIFSMPKINAAHGIATNVKNDWLQFLKPQDYFLIAT